MKAFKFLSKTAFVFSLVLLASCSSDNDIEETNETKTIAKKLEFKANTDLSDLIDESDVTRATLEENYSVSWDKDDKILVYCDNSDQAVDFAITPSSVEGSTATFTNYGEVLPLWFDPDQFYFALYPYASGATFDPQDDMITSSLPTEQSVSVGRTYDKKALFMTACADMDERIFNFLNIPALVKINIKNNGDGKVKFIEIVSKNSANSLSGNFKASSGYGYKGKMPALKFNAVSGADKKHTVRLQIPASAESQDFYIAVLPCTINGFTLKLEGDRYSEIYRRVSSKDSRLKSSKVYDFGSYDIESLTTPEVK